MIYNEFIMIYNINYLLLNIIEYVNLQQNYKNKWKKKKKLNSFLYINIDEVLLSKNYLNNLWMRKEKIYI